MLEAHMIVRRYPYEEPDILELEFLLSNHHFSSSVDVYCRPDSLKEIGQALKIFPSNIPDAYSYEYGSESPDKNYHRFFKMRVYTVGSLGHCAIQFLVNLNQTEPGEGASRFSIYPIEPMALSRLGELFIQFSALHHLEFWWSSDGTGKLLDHYRSGCPRIENLPHIGGESDKKIFP